MKSVVFGIIIALLAVLLSSPWEESSRTSGRPLSVL